MVRDSEQSPNAADSPRNPLDRNGLAIAGFVCAVIAIAYLLCAVIAIAYLWIPLFSPWMPIFSILVFPVWVCGAVFSSIGLARAHLFDGRRKGLAISGIVLTISAAWLWVGILQYDLVPPWGSSGSIAGIIRCDPVDHLCPATPLSIHVTGDFDLDVDWPGGTRLQLDFVGEGSCPKFAIVARSGSGQKFDPGFVGPSSRKCVEGLEATATLGADARHLEVRADGTWTIYVRN